VRRCAALPKTCSKHGTDMQIFMTIAPLALALILFFGPTIVALCRNHSRAMRIFLVNLLFGWTIIGLFVAFAWALSATRPVDRRNPESATSDYGERLFQNRNVVRQADGGAIVYPGLISERGYRLGAGEFRRYLKMRAAETRQSFPRGLITIILGISLFLGFRRLLGPEHGAALAMIAFTALFLAFDLWFFVRRPKAEFREAFPRAPQAHDLHRSERKLLSSLLAFNFLVSAGAATLCTGLIASITLAAAFHTGSITLRAHDGAILLVLLLLAGAGAVYFGSLTIQHIAFLVHHRRGPDQSDLDNLGRDDAPMQPEAAQNALPA